MTCGTAKNITSNYVKKQDQELAEIFIKEGIAENADLAFVYPFAGSHEAQGKASHLFPPPPPFRAFGGHTKGRIFLRVDPTLPSLSSLLLILISLASSVRDILGLPLGRAPVRIVEKDGDIEVEKEEKWGQDKWAVYTGAPKDTSREILTVKKLISYSLGQTEYILVTNKLFKDMQQHFFQRRSYSTMLQLACKPDIDKVAIKRWKGDTTATFIFKEGVKEQMLTRIIAKKKLTRLQAKQKLDETLPEAEKKAGVQPEDKEDGVQPEKVLRKTVKVEKTIAANSKRTNITVKKEEDDKEEKTSSKTQKEWGKKTVKKEEDSKKEKSIPTKLKEEGKETTKKEEDDKKKKTTANMKEKGKRGRRK